MENYENKLISMLETIYCIKPTSIKKAKRGFFGETWRVETKNANYFVKIDYWEHHKNIYAKSLSIIDFMTSNGIDFIPKIIHTTEGLLYHNINNGIVGVFEFVDGENTEDYPIENLFERLAKIYDLDTTKLNIEAENFSIDVYDEYFKVKQNITSNNILNILNENQSQFDYLAKRLQQFADICSNSTDDFVITHGDAGGNCIINKNSFYIIDWDSPKLASIERDTWFFMANQELSNKIELSLNRKLNVHKSAYYCYYSYFYYLIEYLKSFTNNDSINNEKLLKNYFDCWIMKIIEYANKI